jgi:hypothetical protein
VPFDYQPVLSGELVYLRTDDYDALYAVAADPLIWEQHPAKNRHEEPSSQAFFRESLDSGGALIVIDAETRPVIGSARFHGYDEERDEVEIGWISLARSHWGGIYNRETTRLMLQACLPLREQGRLAGRSSEHPVTADRREARGRADWIETRQWWPRKPRLPTHQFGIA